ncbi:hypothetical protein MF271_04320 [Deinococcus sp. KNUC1210]|uniref:hypothetical protein n=1 Tax=Deinococcus sp. KNUC1210 TaxID=2917691 RepID=UPI001EEFC805|nr:hypothetical protein [Deinococcus sp. KNUC1210]ULH15868.1 hypothetical protein MF271_04320 [Deinococcus sp. KNUC1210]
MRRFAPLTIYALVPALLLAACGGGSTTPPPPASNPVDNLTITAKQLSVPVTSYDIGNYSFQSVMVGNSIYFANYSNTAKSQFFARYDISSNTFSSPLAVSNNVCGCGYMSKLVSDGTNIFYIANDATKYTASSNTWTAINYPATAKDNAGEAGVAYANGKIYFVGGRTPSTLFKYYNIAANSWFTGPNYLYATNRSEVAAYKDNIYVLGGSGAETKMASFSTTTNVWTALKDLPFSANTSYENAYSAVLGDDLYVLQGQSVYIYDLVNNVWAKNPITLSTVPSGNSSTLFSNGIKLYIAGKNSSNIPQVYELTVQ